MPVFYWACNLKLSTRTLFSPFYFHPPLPPSFILTDTPCCPISSGTWRLSSLLPGVTGDLGWFISVGWLVSLGLDCWLPCRSPVHFKSVGKEVMVPRAPPLCPWTHVLRRLHALWVHTCCTRQDLDIQAWKQNSSFACNPVSSHPFQLRPRHIVIIQTETSGTQCAPKWLPGLFSPCPPLNHVSCVPQE